MSGDRTTRRRLIVGALAATGFGFARGAMAQSAELPATPECHDGDEQTIAQTAGPFFKPRSPERADFLEPEMKGRRIELMGFVLTQRCHPVRRAIVDLWHADDKGEYDNAGFKLRGHQFTDAEGRYRFRTIVPAVYSGRTRHFHVKVAAPYRPVLTTQLYFPDEPGNKDDSLFRRELLLRTAQAGEEVRARFDFVLDMR